MLSPEGWPYASSGAGRFHCLFGRDSLITALQVLPARPEVARATLDALAARQGVRFDPLTLEEPGKIGHEFRDAPPPSFVAAGWPAAGPFAYYGTADATCWFLVLLRRAGRVVRRGAARPRTGSRGALDAGDGLVRHAPGAFGLAQQGWRDTIDAAGDADGGGFLRADGTNPAPPLADIDTQAVALAALRALVGCRATRRGRAAPTRCTRGCPRCRLGHDGGRGGRRRRARARAPSSAGCCGRASRARFADRLCEPDILTDFGLRTLSSHDPNFRADAYHRGSVWPFDSWLGWGGLRARGRSRPRPSGCGPACCAALDKLGQRARALRGDRRRCRRRSRPPTRSRRGRSAPAGRSNTRSTESVLAAHLSCVSDASVQA